MKKISSTQNISAIFLKQRYQQSFAITVFKIQYNENYTLSLVCRYYTAIHLRIYGHAITNSNVMQSFSHSSNAFPSI